ncbi:MAG: hypothetical protein SNJ71_05405 [Bacteroidales bacterium]
MCSSGLEAISCPFSTKFLKSTDLRFTTSPAIATYTQTVGCKCNGRHNQTKKPKKQTILTGDRRTGNNIQNGQRVSRHSLPTLLYFLFSPPHKNFEILCQPANGTFASRSSQRTTQACKRAVFLPLNNQKY